VGKLTDRINNYKRRLAGRRLRAVADARLERALRAGGHREQELQKLYDEFCRNKSVDL